MTRTVHLSFGRFLRSKSELFLSYLHPIDGVLVVLASVFYLQFVVAGNVGSVDWLYSYAYVGGFNWKVLTSYFAHSSEMHFANNMFGMLIYRLYFTHIGDEFNSVRDIVLFVVGIGIGVNVIVFLLAVIVGVSFPPVVGFSGVLFAFFGYKLHTKLQGGIAFTLNPFYIQQGLLLGLVILTVFGPLYGLIQEPTFAFGFVAHSIGFILGFIAVFVINK